MKKEITIEVPNNYSAITLRKYLKMQKDLETFNGDMEATTAALFYHLCHIEPEMMKKIDTETFTKIKEQLFSFIGKNDFQLIPFVTINGVEYGFEPNLSQMAYGAYMDITKFGDLKINDDWAQVMSILYRPIDKKIGLNYSIEPYDGDIKPELWLDVTMDVHFGAQFFFINLLKELQISILNSLKEKVEETSYKSILAKSGEVMQQSSYSPTMMLELLTK